jgi:hypothetical protein
MRRYYKNLKSGEYCRLEGHPLAVKNVIERQWPHKKTLVKRITEAEFNRRRPKVLFGLHYPMMFPNYHRVGKSGLRKGDIYLSTITMNFAYFYP